MDVWGKSRFCDNVAMRKDRAVEKSDMLAFLHPN